MRVIRANQLVGRVNKVAASARAMVLHWRTENAEATVHLSTAGSL